MSAEASVGRVVYSQAGDRVRPPTIARLMTLAVENRELLSLAAGFTDSVTLPAESVAQAAAGIAREGRDREPLQYGTNAGRRGLRQLLLDRLRSQENAETSLSVDHLLVSNGSQQALYLAIQTLCDPGDLVLVDQPSYFVFLEMLSGLGVTPVGIPLDASGRVSGTSLRQLLSTLRETGQLQRLRAVYFVSYYSNPSSRTLSAEEKATVAGVLDGAGLRLPVIEDAAYRELYYTEPPASVSVLAMPEWAAFPRLYLGTLTKPYATGLKVGFGVCTEPDWLHRMLYLKGHQDFGTANFNQAVIERVIASGEFERHLSRIRPHYARKAATLSTALDEGGLRQLGWKWEEPDGGLYLWLTGPRELDTGMTGAFCQACIAAGVLFVPGELCYPDPAPKNRVRLSFGVLGESELRDAARRFVGVVRATGSGLTGS